MKKLILAGIIGAVSISSGCSDSDSVSSDVSLTGDAALPEQMSLVTAQDDEARSSLMGIGPVLSSRAVHDTSTLDSTSDYATSAQNTYVHLEAVRPISFIDSLLCFTNQSRPLLMNGEGNYVSWNDAGRCFEEKGGEGDSQGDNNQTTSYVTFVANSSQASASAPLIFNAWIEDYAGQSGEGQGPNAIKILGEVTKTPTDDNPFGAFTLTYGLLPDIANGEDANTGFGEVNSSETSDGGASFTLYQKDVNEYNNQAITCTTSASVDYNEATETGVARTGSECTLENSSTVIPEASNTYALAVNSDFVHMAQASTYAAIEAGTYGSEVCLARDSYNNVVWSYSLFNKSDGSEVELNSGLQLKVDGDGDGSGSDSNGFESWGHIGYWGSWREDGQAFADGETVQEATYDDTTGDSFTVKVSPGRLTKNTVSSVNLSDLDGVGFSTWVYEGDLFLFNTKPDLDGDTGTDAFFDVMVEANSNNDGFEVVGIRSFDQNGETITEVNPAVALDLNTNVSLNMWSRQLGGDVRYISGSTAVRMFERSFVNGGETGTGELFASGASQTLKCFDRCLDVNIAATDVDGSAQQDDVFRSNDAETDQDYTFAQSDLTLKIGADSVVFANAVTKDDLQASSYWQWGLSSGPMVTSTVATAGSITSAQTLYAAIEAGTVTEFYVWETGLEHWQQQIRLLDGSDNVVAFDKPITMKYTHATANDRNAPASGDVAQNDAVFLLEYGGKGQLWGLPFVQNGDRWNPVISLKDGTILGSSDQYIVKARDVEQTMNAAPAGSCDDLPLSAPSQSVPSAITGGVFDIGDIPTLTDETPSLIDGEPVE